MSKPEALRLLMLLSALESWSFSTGSAIPDYLSEKVQDSMDALAKIVLEGKEA